MRSRSPSPTCGVRQAISVFAGIGSSQRPSQAGRIAGSAIPNAIHEQAGRPIDSAAGTALNVPLDTNCDRRIDEVRFEAGRVEAHTLRVTTQVGILEMALAAKEQVIHLPEPTLAIRRLGCLGCRLRMRVDAAQRKVAEDKLEARTRVEHATNVAHRRGGVWALIVAVDHEL